MDRFKISRACRNIVQMPLCIQGLAQQGSSSNRCLLSTGQLRGGIHKEALWLIITLWQARAPNGSWMKVATPGDLHVSSGTIGWRFTQQQQSDLQGQTQTKIPQRARITHFTNLCHARRGESWWDLWPPGGSKIRKKCHLPFVPLEPKY